MVRPRDEAGVDGFRQFDSARRFGPAWIDLFAGARGGEFFQRDCGRIPARELVSVRLLGDPHFQPPRLAAVGHRQNCFALRANQRYFAAKCVLHGTHQPTAHEPFVASNLHGEVGVGAPTSRRTERVQLGGNAGDELQQIDVHRELPQHCSRSRWAEKSLKYQLLDAEFGGFRCLPLISARWLPPDASGPADMAAQHSRFRGGSFPVHSSRASTNRWDAKPGLAVRFESAAAVAPRVWQAGRRRSQPRR